MFGVPVARAVFVIAEFETRKSGSAAVQFDVALVDPGEGGGRDMSWASVGAREAEDGCVYRRVRPLHRCFGCPLAGLVSVEADPETNSVRDDVSCGQDLAG